jgi:transposase
MAYDVIFRKRVIEYKNAGHTFKEADEAFGVDSKRYYSRKKQLEETGSLECRPPKERDGKTNKNEPARLLEERPGWHLRGFAEKLNVCPRAIDKMFKKLGVARKKNFYLFGSTRQFRPPPEKLVVRFQGSSCPQSSPGSISAACSKTSFRYS